MKSRTLSSWIFKMLLVYVFSTDVVLSKRYKCPHKCDCYFSNTNLVTDCSLNAFWSIPFENIDVKVHTLNMNGNRLLDTQHPFPVEIEPIVLHIADNYLINVENTFLGLHHLEYIDLSNNHMLTMSPYAFK